jgi:hypothetical protein
VSSIATPHDPAMISCLTMAQKQYSQVTMTEIAQVMSQKKKKSIFF